ncbi:MAG: DUF6883 domain-containing protein [Gemmataceae bacterium]
MLVSTANASPSVARASRSVRSFSGGPGWSFWNDNYNYIGAALSGLGEGAVNIATGARDAVVEVALTGRDLVTIYGDWIGFDPSRLESKLFQGATQTANNLSAAASFDQQLVLGIVTLGVAPLVESGYNAVATGDSTQFSQQAGGFGVMVLVPYAGVKGLNALSNVPIRLPVPSAGGVMVGADGSLVAIPSGVAWAEVGVITFAVPAEAGTAITVVAMSTTGLGGGGPQQQTQPQHPATTEASVADKRDRYLLNPDNPVGGPKAKWFQEALGFSGENAADLASQIVFDERRAFEIGVTQHGTKYNQIISILGANGRMIEVNFACIKNTDGIVRLVTAIPTPK